MNILWVKDNNIGHEKQVKNLLDEISKKIDLHIDERLVKGFFPFFTHLENVEEKKYDLIIGAGHKTYSLILDTKKNQKSDNVIFFEGSIAKVSDSETDENIVLIAVGGKNKHYYFDEDHIIAQINYFMSVHPNKNCYIYNSRRTPASTNEKLKSLQDIYNNIKFLDFNQGATDFETSLMSASSKLITRDSVNMVFESLSCKGKTYLMDMKKIRSSNKVVKVIDSLVENKKIGFIDCSDITDGVSKMKLQKQNIHNEIYAEVEKISYKLLQLI